MKQKSVMKHNFARAPSIKPNRSQFDRSHGMKTTFDGGYLVPIFVDEALPGDTLNLNMAGFGRLATPIHPIMDNMFAETFFFAVPNRLLWQNWEKFNGAQVDPGDSTDFTLPARTVTPQIGTLSDYFGLPVGNALSDISDLPYRAYNLIYNEWFRDENLQDSLVETTGDAASGIANYVLRRRGKRHDYMTACLPFPQKGDSVSLPLGTSAPIAVAGDTGAVTVEAPQGETDLVVGGGSNIVLDSVISGQPMFADLSNATAATINALRQAATVQQVLERDARGGTRYTEIIRSHFGVISPDMRLQRPEYLGGGSSVVGVRPVEQTSQSDTTPQANLAGIGTVEIRNHGFTKSFTEHCTIIGLINVRADLTYQQGINRMWSRQTRFDFFWPALALIGEQAVLEKEIFADGSATDEDVFGYQERYAEYRYKPSIITGEFRSAAAASLDSWHLSQDFASAPTLNATFIEDTPPIDRIIAVPTEPHFIFDAHFQYICARPMPLTGIPGITRF